MEHPTANQLLWSAVHHGAHPDTALPLLEQALAQGAVLSSLDGNGNNPLRSLVEVCCPGKEHLARALVEVGINPLLPGCSSETTSSLHWVIQEEDQTTAAALIDVALAKGYKDEDGRNALEHLLATSRYFHMVADLLEERVEAMPARTPGLLHALVQNENVFVVPQSPFSAQSRVENHEYAAEVGRWLLGNGHDPFLQNSEGNTVLEAVDASLKANPAWKLSPAFAAALDFNKFNAAWAEAPVRPRPRI